MSDCGLPYSVLELRHFKVGDLLTFFNASLYLVISTHVPEKHRVELTLLDMVGGRGVQSYQQSDHWVLGKVKP